ncbi:MAG: arylamine N-acetyltransferase [Defluviitaleaceae bacterium]|nr:arylamine N-acetyltransferase [Defluviitaleaceae bacterium]MCL2275684.1 arylamine N-acetyltransferase [Defluviitaleaceae bacterium]
MQVASYLSRIRFEGEATPTYATLCQLQRKHLLSVPWENLDIVRNVPLSLEIPALYDKIVTRGRGGYCFELNALFAWLLRRLGFNVTEYFARYLRGESSVPKRRHRTLRVECEGKFYLCDVGVGEPILLTPIQLRAGCVQVQNGERYKIMKDEFLGYVLTEQYKGEWRNVYSFTHEPALPEDFTAISYYCENHADSVFRTKDMVHIFTPDGRKSVFGREYKHFSAAGITGYTPATEKAYEKLLMREFGIRL